MPTDPILTIRPEESVRCRFHGTARRIEKPDRPQLILELVGGVELFRAAGRGHGPRLDT